MHILDPDPLLYNLISVLEEQYTGNSCLISIILQNWANAKHMSKNGEMPLEDLKTEFTEAYIHP